MRALITCKIMRSREITTVRCFHSFLETFGAIEDQKEV